MHTSVTLITAIFDSIRSENWNDEDGGSNHQVFNANEPLPQDLWNKQNYEVFSKETRKSFFRVKLVIILNVCLKSKFYSLYVKDVNKSVPYYG